MKATARGLPFMMSALEGGGGNGKVYKGKGGCMNVTVTRGVSKHPDVLYGRPQGR